MDQVIDTLLGQPRHLLLSGEARQVARARSVAPPAISAPRWTSAGSIVSSLGLARAWRNARPAPRCRRPSGPSRTAPSPRSCARLRASGIAGSATKNSGWPASEGMFSMRELPSSPWQAPHCWMRSASGMFCGRRAPAQKATAASPRASGRHHSQDRLVIAVAHLAASGFLRVVGDAVGRAVLLVGHQQRAVRHLQHVARPAVELVLLLVEQAGQERLDLGLAAVGPAPSRRRSRTSARGSTSRAAR